MKIINQFFHDISQTYLLDVIPVDLLLHFVIGLILTVWMMKKTASLIKAAALVATLAIAKEIYDLTFVYPASWHEYVSDLLASVAPVFLFGMVRWGLRRKRRHRRAPDVVKY